MGRRRKSGGFHRLPIRVTIEKLSSLSSEEKEEKGGVADITPSTTEKKGEVGRLRTPLLYSAVHGRKKKRSPPGGKKGESEVKACLFSSDPHS